jgi:hypothetical protein
MKFRNRRDDRECEVPSGTQVLIEGSGGSRGVWQAATHLLARADAAVDRALGLDSEEFLDSNRQEGGQ